MPVESLAALEIVRFLASGPTPEQIVAYHPSPAASERAYALITGAVMFRSNASGEKGFERDSKYPAQKTRYPTTTQTRQNEVLTRRNSTHQEKQMVFFVSRWADRTIIGS